MIGEYTFPWEKWILFEMIFLFLFRLWITNWFWWDSLLNTEIVRPISYCSRYLSGPWVHCFFPLSSNEVFFLNLSKIAYWITMLFIGMVEISLSFSSSYIETKNKISHYSVIFCMSFSEIVLYMKVILKKELLICQGTYYL